MKKRKVFLLISIILISLNILGIQISIEKREILAVDELDITSSNPDIIRINNGLFVLEALPNRGRIIWRLYSLSEREKFIYSSEDSYILPFMDEITSQYFFELGGSYISIPWNPRSNQPYPYEKYDIVKDGNMVRMILEGMNPINKISSKVELTVKDNDSKILINIALQNLSEKEITLSVMEFVNFDFSEDESIITDLKELNRKKQKDFGEYKLVTVKDLNFFGIMRKKHGLKKLLGNNYSRHYIQIWGKNWEEYVGGAPIIRLVSEKTPTTLSPNEKLYLKIVFEYIN